MDANLILSAGSSGLRLAAVALLMAGWASMAAVRTRALSGRAPVRSAEPPAGLPGAGCCAAAAKKAARRDESCRKF